MPGSSEKGKSTIKKWFDRLEPETVLDVGPGWGTYSKLLRKKGQFWHAIEIYEPYIRQFNLKKYYDKIFVGDIRSFTSGLRYDMVICGDVLEHIKNKEAEAVLKNLLANSKNIIVSLPLDAETRPGKGTGDKDWGNPHELHRGQWSHQLFKKAVQKEGGIIEDYKKFHELAVYLIRRLKKYKIVGICQIYNELEKGNLKRFLKYILPVVEYLIIYDDGSTDGSFEYLQKISSGKIHIIRSGFNDFADEVSHRKLLLEKALQLNADFVLWLDADEVLSSNASSKLQDLCDYCRKNNLDALNFHEINIWRSSTWQRVDGRYDIGWFTRLWRVNPNLKFGVTKKGLHQISFLPESIKKTRKTEKIKVLHYGFANQYNLAYKYITYRSFGQRGYQNLDRLINEDKLILKHVDKNLFPPGLWKENEPPPKPLSFEQALANVDEFSPKILRPKFSIACLIYKSTDWLKFIYRQVLRYTDMRDKEFYFVANDATPEVLKYLHDNYIPHYIYRNSEKQKKEWYINNVYRAWNFAAKVARGDFIIFINSDMAFSPDWFENLIKAYNGRNCLVSRLVESGKLKSGTYGIERDFGKKTNNYKENAFLRFAQKIKNPSIKNDGLYMPLLIRKDHFLKVGGYPEGNVKPKSDIFHPKIAEEGEKVIPGDNILMMKLASIGIRHQTVFNSIAYHFQCGEMDEKRVVKSETKKSIAICNDLTTGVLGEKVLWDYLVDKLSGAYSVDKRIVGSVGDFEENAKSYIYENHPETQIIIQNATFIGAIDPKRYTISFLQDDLRSMKRKSPQQEKNLELAQKIVANSHQTALSYSEYDIRVIPIGVDDKLFKPLNKKLMRRKYGFGPGKIGIFVGNFSEVKGWEKIKKCIKNHPEIFWILVSKYRENYQAKNTVVFNQIKQKKLVELLNCADFFIIGSPVETLCLAAIEAAFCNLPLVMSRAGIFKNFSDKDLAKIGIFGDDLERGIDKVFQKKFNPRNVLKQKNLNIETTIEKWQKMLEETILEQNIKKYQTFSKKISIFYRQKILKSISDDEYFNFYYFLIKKAQKAKQKIQAFLILTSYQILQNSGLVKPVKKILGRNEK